MTEAKKCLDCGDVFSGRSDKKFCSDQCRNNYNNKLNSDNTGLIRNTNRILKKNRLILEKLNPLGKAGVSREKLIHNGFNFRYVTGYYQTKKGDIYFYCYDQGYIKTGENYYTLVHRKEYLE